MNQEEALGVFNGNGADVGLMPQAGCPGPERENLEDSRGDVLAALLLLDTAWWMLEPATASRCRQSTKEEVIRELVRVLSEASDVPVIVAAHHPLQTGGTHGGNSGALRWLANRIGLLRGDLNTPQYRALIDSLSGAFGRASRPVIYVAGTITRSRSSTSPWKAPRSYTLFPAAAARSPVRDPSTAAGSRRDCRVTCASTSGPAPGSSSACSPSARRRRLKRISVAG